MQRTQQFYVLIQSDPDQFLISIVWHPQFLVFFGSVKIQTSTCTW